MQTSRASCTLQPIFPYFLRNHFNDAAQKPLQQAIETAFREHYDQVGRVFYNLLQSKDAQERQIGQIVVHLEYENLMTALSLALAAQESILNTYRTLSAYLDMTQGQRQGLALGQTVLSRLQDYATEKLAGPLGVEFVGVIDNIANRQLLLKQYAQAEASYQKALSLWLQNKSYDADEIRKIIAGTYHQLGRVAEEQRQWTQAQQYYQQALEIFVEYNDSHNGNIVMNSLARLWQESGDAAIPTHIASILGIPSDEVEASLRQRTEEQSGEKDKN